MHIPDGFISPQTFLPAYAAAAGLWALALRRLRAQLTEETLPFLAVLTALTFVLTLVALPLPGGTSAHATGVGLLTVLFGPWTAFLAFSLVLALQALLFGDGGITALPVNALAMGLLGALCAAAAWRGLRRLHEATALVAAGWLSLVLPAAGVALVLGLQPLIAQDAAGRPLFFPFGWGVTLPAVVLPHLLMGVAEGALTLLGYRYLRRLRGSGAA